MRERGREIIERYIKIMGEREKFERRKEELASLVAYG